MKQVSEPKMKNQSYARWLGFGVEFCGVLCIFCYIGYKLDQRLNTSPWFLLGGFFVGFAGMFYIIIKEAWNLGRKK